MIQDHELVKGDKEVKLNLISREKAKQWTENTHIAKTPRWKKMKWKLNQWSFNKTIFQGLFNN